MCNFLLGIAAIVGIDVSKAVITQEVYDYKRDQYTVAEITRAQAERLHMVLSLDPSIKNLSIYKNKDKGEIYFIKDITTIMGSRRVPPKKREVQDGP